MDWPEMIEVVSEAHYKDWEFHLHMREGPPWMQLRFVVNGERHYCRKWMLSQNMTTSELVQTCMKAVLAAEEHEARERFTYAGKHIYGPHINVEALMDVCDNLDAREPTEATQRDKEPTHTE